MSPQEPIPAHEECDESLFVSFDTELYAAVENLLSDVDATVTWTLDGFLQKCRLHEDLLEEVERKLDTADTYGEEFEPEVVEAVLENLDVTAEKLFAAEQDGILAEETFRTARSEFPLEPDDDRLVTVGVRVDPFSARRPRAHLLHMLLRQLNGKRFDGSYRIVTMPRWLYRRIENHAEHARVWIVGLDESVPTGEILEVANSLWEPQQSGAYQSPVAVLEAARLLSN